MIMLPPIIEDYIVKISDPKTPVHIRENYAQMLLMVIQKSQIAVDQFNNEKVKQASMFGRRSK